MANNGTLPGEREFVAPRRHPLDPDPVPATKAAAVRWLGVVALILSPAVAGVVPAVVALALAADLTAQMRTSRGFLTGVGALRTGVRLARVALLVALAVVVIGVVVTLMRAGGQTGLLHYGQDVN